MGLEHETEMAAAEIMTIFVETRPRHWYVTRPSRDQDHMTLRARLGNLNRPGGALWLICFHAP